VGAGICPEDGFYDGYRTLFILRETKLLLSRVDQVRPPGLASESVSIKFSRALLDTDWPPFKLSTIGGSLITTFRSCPIKNIVAWG